MSSWYSSWFSGFPTFDFAVPATIQRRFFSFVLRKTLGRFLKPGQLDLHQIDSQLGSGAVHVTDLELDGQAINELLGGLPLRLHDGYISGVTVRVPFPNPLTSSVGLHVRALHLTLYVVTDQRTPPVPPLFSGAGLADSVASVAQTFVHRELTPKEEATLRESLHPGHVNHVLTDESENLPGGFDPFVRHRDRDDAREVQGATQTDNDPVGVSVFASFIERLLARFEFSALDTKITVVHPGKSSFTFTVREVLYRTRDDEGQCSQTPSDRKPSPETGDLGRFQGQIRTITVSGFSLASRDLRLKTHSPRSTTSTPSPISGCSPQPGTDHGSFVGTLSRTSSSSSLDDDVQLMMSQSIATLPPRPLSPASSVASTMYQSVMSSSIQGTGEYTSQVHAPVVACPETYAPPSPKTSGHHPSTMAQEQIDDVMLTFGPQPIVIQLSTLPAHTGHSGHDFRTAQILPEAASFPIGDREVLQLSVSTGILSCALRACQVRMILDLMDACRTAESPCATAHTEGDSRSSPSVIPGLSVTIYVRGIVAIFLSDPRDGQSYTLSSYFEHPFIPPRLCCPYVRLLLDDIVGSFSMSAAPTSSPNDPSTARPTPENVKATLSDISLFAFHAVSTARDSQVAAPIIISDYYLPVLGTASYFRPSFTSERPSRIQLPMFDVVDWTQTKFQGNSTRLSTWRTKRRSKADKLRSPLQRNRDLPSPPNPFVISPLAEDGETFLPPAIEVIGRCLPSETSDLHIKVAPLHVFLDLAMIFDGNVLFKFVHEITSSSMFALENNRCAPGSATDWNPRGSSAFNDHEDSDNLVHNTMSAQPQERELERRRLERLVLDDLNLGMNHGVGPKALKELRNSTGQQECHRKRKVPSGHTLRVRLSCSVIRVEARCVYPTERSPRSGCLLVDIHDVSISNSPDLKGRLLRFSEGLQPPLRSASSQVGIGTAQLREITIAYAKSNEDQARTVLMLGSMPESTGDAHASTLFASDKSTHALPVCLRLGRITRPNHGQPTIPERLSLVVDVPLINLIIDKESFDGLQYWADDVARLLEHSVSEADSLTETLPSRNPSLIGSRFFVRARKTSSHGEDSTLDSPIHESPANSGETVVKVNITEALLRISLPREQDLHHTRPFDIQASDIDVLLELKPEGKDETVITAGVMDLRVADTSALGSYTPLVVLTAPRSLSATPKPMAKARIASLVVPETIAKESKIKLSLWGITCYVPSELGFASDLALFAKAPPGVFESVVPSERTALSIGVIDVSVMVQAPEHPGASVLHIGEADFSTEILFIVDSIRDASESLESLQKPSGNGVTLWKSSGYALVAEIANCDLSFCSDNSIFPPDQQVDVSRIELRVHLCADTLAALTGFISHLVPKDNTNDLSDPARRGPSTLAIESDHQMIASLDEDAFRGVPEVGNTADMINDDLPANLDYLDASFGAAAGLRELRDDDLEDFDINEQSGRTTPVPGETGVVSNVGGETIRVFRRLSFKEHHFDTITPEVAGNQSYGDTSLRVRVHDADITLFLHDGYDWPRTRRIIEKEIKEMRKKLARIRQLVATGQTQEPIEEETSAMLFNSIHIGLEQDLDNMDPDTLIAAIDSELDEAVETGTQSSWQSLHPASPGRPRSAPTRIHGKRLTRSKGPSIEIHLSGLNAEVDHYRPGETLVSRSLFLVKDLEILDHIKTSTWRKFVTALRNDSRGNIRETDSNMARVELLTVRPSPHHPAEEARLRVKILPLRLYVDQDALDFFKKFFAFKDADSPAAPNDAEKNKEIYFQHAEVFPVDIKLDYKPRRVDYRALREGRTIELMNFFHFDGAEMTLRHLTLHGITGWPRFFDTLNDLWTPDVKATQLVDVISGVAPIRSMVNVGSGVADLVLLPIAQYKKDGRIVRGVQKGTKAFVQSTAMEAIKLGARLATGTQVILEQTENVLGGQFRDPVTTETLQIPYEDDVLGDSEEDLISRYAAQPSGVGEGVQSAYRSLRKGLHAAAQTILAVPMEVYERSGNEGSVRAVIRAVPIAVLKPMIGASEAVSKTLMGLHNTLDPNVRHENEAKYKHR